MLIDRSKWILLLLVPAFVYSQKLTVEIPETAGPEITRYFQEAGYSAFIYNGKEHSKYPAHFVGHPFLVADQYTIGELYCDETFYPGVSLKLDWYTGELIINTPDRRYNIIIPSERLEYATLYGYHLFYHYPDGLPGSPPAGYYLQLKEGTHKILKREIVNRNERIDDRRVEVFFTRANRFYVLKDGQYYRTNSLGALLKLFPSKKRELKQFVKQNNLSYKTDPEKLITAVVEQYEKLTR